MSSPGDSDSSLATLPTEQPRRDSNYAAIRSPTLSRRPTNVELSRMESLKSTHKSTVGSATGPDPREKWLPFGGGKDYPPMLPDPEQYVVEFSEQDDPMHPHNWPLRTKYDNGISLTEPGRGLRKRG